jgi:hypothetical protein
MGVAIASIGGDREGGRVRMRIGALAGGRFVIVRHFALRRPYHLVAPIDSISPLLTDGQEW